MPEGYSLGDAVQAILDTEKTFRLPADITTPVSGQYARLPGAGSTVWLIVAAVVAMAYIVLGVLYESLHHPITDSLSAAYGGRRRWR